MNPAEKVKTILDKLTVPLCEDDPFRQGGRKIKFGSTSDLYTLDFQGFVNRISTFKPEDWSSDPNAAIFLSKYGFKGVSGCKVSCCSCGVEVDMGVFLGKRDVLRTIALRSHKQFCRWLYVSTPEEYFTISKNPHGSLQDLKVTFTEMMTFQTSIPLIHKDNWVKMGISEAFMTSVLNFLEQTYSDILASCVVLSLCGWVKRNEKSLQCNFCQRVVGVWNFISDNVKRSTAIRRPSKHSRVISLLYSEIRRSMELSENAKVVDMDCEGTADSTVQLPSGEQPHAVPEESSEKDKEGVTGPSSVHKNECMFKELDSTSFHRTPCHKREVEYTFTYTSLWKDDCDKDTGKRNNSSCFQSASSRRNELYPWKHSLHPRALSSKRNAVKFLLGKGIRSKRKKRKQSSKYRQVKRKCDRLSFENTKSAESHISGVARNIYETRRDFYGDERDVYEAERDYYGTERDDYEAEGDDYETERDIYEAERDAYEAERDTNEAGRGVYGARRDVKEVERDIKEAEREIYEAQRNIYEAKRNIYEAVRDVFGDEGDFCDADTDIYETETETEYTRKEPSDVSSKSVGNDNEKKQSGDGFKSNNNGASSDENGFYSTEPNVRDEMCSHSIKSDRSSLEQGTIVISSSSEMRSSNNSCLSADEETNPDSDTGNKCSPCLQTVRKQCEPRMKCVVELKKLDPDVICNACNITTAQLNQSDNSCDGPANSHDGSCANSDGRKKRKRVPENERNGNPYDSGLLPRLPSQMEPAHFTRSKKKELEMMLNERSKIATVPSSKDNGAEVIEILSSEGEAVSEGESKNPSQELEDNDKDSDIVNDNTCNSRGSENNSAIPSNDEEDAVLNPVICSIVGNAEIRDTSGPIIVSAESICEEGMLQNYIEEEGRKFANGCRTKSHLYPIDSSDNDSPIVSSPEKSVHSAGRSYDASEDTSAAEDCEESPRPKRRRIVSKESGDHVSRVPELGDFINDLPPTYFHPELEHRYWCIWRIEVAECLQKCCEWKKGWELYMAAIEKGLKLQNAEKVAIGERNEPVLHLLYSELNTLPETLIHRVCHKIFVEEMHITTYLKMSIIF